MGVRPRKAGRERRVERKGEGGRVREEREMGVRGRKGEDGWEMKKK